MRFLPLFLDLSSGPVAPVGAGASALNKLRLLRSAGANVRWFARDAASARRRCSPARGLAALKWHCPIRCARISRNSLR